MRTLVVILFFVLISGVKVYAQIDYEIEYTKRGSGTTYAVIKNHDSYLIIQTRTFLTTKDKIIDMTSASGNTVVQVYKNGQPEWVDMYVYTRRYHSMFRAKSLARTLANSSWRNF